MAVDYFARHLKRTRALSLPRNGGWLFRYDKASKIAHYAMDNDLTLKEAAHYSVFFSTPLKMLPWPVAVGMLAHALRWFAITKLGAGVAVGALVPVSSSACCSHRSRAASTCRSRPSAL